MNCSLIDRTSVQYVNVLKNYTSDYVLDVKVL